MATENQKESVAVRMSAERIARVDAWRAGHPVPPSRSAAIDALVVIALDVVERDAKREAQR